MLHYSRHDLDNCLDSAEHHSASNSAPRVVWTDLNAGQIYGPTDGTQPLITWLIGKNGQSKEGGAGGNEDQG